MKIISINVVFQLNTFIFYMQKPVKYLHSESKFLCTGTKQSI